jgi:hypothetical protein
MAFSTTVQPIVKPATVPANQPSNNISDALLSMVLLSMYGAQMSKKTVRKLKRKFFFTSLKLKLKSLFSPRTTSDRTLLYIILGVALLALLLIDPILVLALAVVILILILAGVL